MARSEFKNWAVDEAGNVIASAAFEVRWRSDDSLVTTLYDAATGSGTVSNPGTATSGGLVDFWLPYGEYEVTVGSGASAVTYPFDAIPPYDVPRTFASRAAAVAELEALADRGVTIADGTVISDGTVSYVATTGATAISDMPGWLPVEPFWLEHWGVVTSSSKSAPTTDYTSEVQAACSFVDGVLNFSGWVKITDKITVQNDCKIDVPAGRTQGGFSIFSDFSGAATAVLEPGTGEAGATIGQLGMWFEQPSAPANRAALNSYPPAIDISSIPRGRIEALRIEQATDGIYGVGNCGGYRFGILELGCFGTNIILDGALDFIHLESLHVWPFGFAGNSSLTTIFYDGTTVGFDFEAVDGLAADKVATFRVKNYLGETSSSSILPFVLSAVQLDGDGSRLIFRGSKSIIGNLYSTKTGAATDPDLDVVGGEHYISNAHLIGNAPDSILVQSGASLSIDGGEISQLSSNRQGAVVESGGYLRLNNVQFDFPDAAGTVPFVEQESGGTLVVQGCTGPTGHATPRTEAVTYNSDVEDNVCDGISLHPHGVSFNSTWSEGVYSRREITVEVASSGAQKYLRSYGSGEGWELLFQKATGTVASPTEPASGTVIGDISYAAWDGTAFDVGGYIRVTKRSGGAAGTVPMEMSYLLEDTSGVLQTVLKMDSDSVYLYTDGSERLHIDSGGDVGIGTNTPAQKLHIEDGNLLVSNDTAGASIFTTSSNTGTGAIWFGDTDAYNSGSVRYDHSTDILGLFALGSWRVATAGSERIRIDSSGNVLIGTTSTGASKLRVVGLPTSSAGLSSGDVWNDSGTLKIV